MLSSARSRAVWQFSRRAQVSARRAYAFGVNDQQEINDPKKPKEVSNVSKTNELPTDPGHLDARLQESAEEGEKQRMMQAPNRANVWSRSQNPRKDAMAGPRFEQTVMEYQVCDLGYRFTFDISASKTCLIYEDMLTLSIAQAPSCYQPGSQATCSVDS